MVEILLTADRTMMSNYHNKEFLGFSTSAPPNLIPDWMFKFMFFPPVKVKNGIPLEAPYGLRKIEAKLLDEGFDVLTVDPDHLGHYLKNAKVLGVHVMDPFGLGPSSSTFSRILNTGDPYLAKYFRMVFTKSVVRKAKRRGIRIIVGGPGVWQFKYRLDTLDEYGIDCIIDGEGEHVISHLFHMALEDRVLPKYYQVPFSELPSMDDISEIKNPSINGLIEIGRGCPRGCSFCSVTLKPLRWYSLDRIKREIKVNVNKRNLNAGLLHAEDVLLYGSNSVTPNREKILDLHRLAKKYYKNLHWSHTSIASITTDRKLMEELHDLLIDDYQTWWGVEIGIETGSPNLIKKAMPAKAKPFKPEEWPNIVKEASGIMMDSNLLPACTLITGLPQETEDDTLKTIELVDDLKWFRSLIVPLFFVPMGKLQDKDWFKREELNELQKELMIKCLSHDLRWSRDILEWYLEGKWFAPILKNLYKMFIWMVERKGRQIRLFESIDESNVTPYLNPPEVS